MPGNEFANPPIEARGRGWPDLEAEATQNATQTHLDIMKLYLRQDGARAVILRTLAELNEHELRGQGAIRSTSRPTTKRTIILLVNS
jgi:hypothetical protein